MKREKEREVSAATPSSVNFFLSLFISISPPFFSRSLLGQYILFEKHACELQTVVFNLEVQWIREVVSTDGVASIYATYCQFHGLKVQSSNTEVVSVK